MNRLHLVVVPSSKSSSFSFLMFFPLRTFPLVAATSALLYLHPSSSPSTAECWRVVVVYCLRRSASLPCA